MIGPVGEGDDLAHGAIELPRLIERGNIVAGVNKRLDQFRLCAVVAHLIVKLLAQKTCAAAGDINDLTDEVRIDALHKVIKVEVNVVDAAGELGRKVVPQILGVEVLKIGVCQNKSATTLGHLDPVHREKTVGIDRCRLPQPGGV